MGPLGVVEADPLADDPFGLEAVGQLMQVDRLVFERPPQALDEDIVHAAAPAYQTVARCLSHAARELATIL